MIMAAGVAAFCGLGATASAQQTIRPSETGAAAAEMRSDITLPKNYNLKLGPVLVTAGASLALEFNDNVNLAEYDRQADFIIRPGIQLDAFWQATPLNTLHLSLGFGYAFYTQNSSVDSNSILIDPGTALSFDVYVGDFMRLNFHDRISIVQNPIDEPGISNVARFDRLENAVGVTALMDFNQLTFVLGYDHFNYNTINSSELNILDHQEEQVLASASLRLSDAMVVGIDGNYGYVHYDQNYNNDGNSYSAAPFVEMNLSHYTKLRITAGYQGMSFDNNGTSGDTQDASGFFGNITIAQRLNQYWTHSLTAGREFQLGLTTNYTEYTFARYAATWLMNSRVSVTFDTFVEDADDSGTAAQSSEHSFRVGAGAAVSYKLNSKLGMNLAYHYVNKQSDLILRSYYQDSVVLSLSYSF